MKVILVTSGFVLAVCGTAALAASQAGSTVGHDSKVTVNKAEKIAIQEFKKRAKGPVTKISVRLLEENDKDWVFVLENEEQTPVLGSELYVIVSKRTAKAESYFGK